jgi:hypothetical protein
MKRGAFIAGLGSAAARPFSAGRAAGSAACRDTRSWFGRPQPPFCRGLADADYIVGQNAMIKSRSANNNVGLLRGLAADPVLR